MESEFDPVSSVFQQLRQVGSEKIGHGWKERVNRGLQRATGYITKDMNKRTMRLTTLFDVLDLLGENPVQFFERALQPPARKPLDSTELLMGTSNPQANLFVERLTADLELATRPDIRHFYESPLDLIRARLKSDPSTAAKLAESSLGLLARGRLPEPLALPLLLEWSACQLRLHRTDHAHAALCFCHRVATDLQADFFRADALLRLSAVALRITADAGVALAIANESYLEFSDMGSSIGIGQALVTRARHLYNLGRIEPAVRNFRLALHHLPERSAFRCSAYQSLGLIYLETGELGQAERNLTLALAQVEGQPYEEGMICWTRAHLANRLGDHRTAEARFNEAREMLMQPAPVQSVLVSLDLAELYLENNAPAAATRVTKELIPLLQPLRSNPVIETVVLSLLRAVIAGTALTAEGLSEAARTIQESESACMQADRIL